MKRSAAATLRRTLRRGVTWRRKWDGNEEICIERLISPLRYDVAVRAQFFAFLNACEDLSDADVTEAARSQPYRVWFERVAMPRFRPWTLADSNLLESQFDERVLRSRSMARSFRDKGFDSRTPVMLRYHRGDVVTDSGVHVSAHLHVGDGGHRLALLMGSGQPLQPAQFRVDPRPTSFVIDNTAILAEALDLSEAEYTRFVSAGYADEQFERLSDLLDHVSIVDPARVDELTCLLHAHGRKAVVAGS
ncbi:hypothetical protein BN12_4000006 [Nostocoides japonicum T1-X7]|uniref:Uncharacterized protein n=1 Tax=Nostocoides japonicum T1-X7 TaxID=1194083 RepID=A0A077M4T7_9MICO|nr:hypothetical protein [Tetrasphaera japonica]CCH79114.1 hypothetical protein BN12_4000006 [Tetrasphaera japonica T1-X7]